jgi:hypothetical protein
MTLPGREDGLPYALPAGHGQSTREQTASAPASLARLHPHAVLDRLVGVRDHLVASRKS